MDPELSPSMGRALIGKKYYPFHDCKTRSDKERKRLENLGQVGVFWVVQAVQLIVALAGAYEAIHKNSGSTDQLCTEINSKLDEMRAQLDDINKNIDRIIDLLMQLPAIIRGQVDASLTKQALGKADQMVALIHDRIRPAYINQYLDDLRRILDNLQTEIGGIVGLRGITGVLIVAPYLAAWMAGSTALQKARKRKDSTWNIDSPWTSTFMNQQEVMFRDLFLQIEKTDEIYAKGSIPNMPPHNRSLEVRGAALFPTSNPLNFGYFLTCPFFGGERLQYATLGQKPKDVNPRDPDHSDATSAWASTLTERHEIVAFYDTVPELYQTKDSLMKVFSEPVGVWDHN